MNTRGLFLIAILILGMGCNQAPDNLPQPSASPQEVARTGMIELNSEQFKNGQLKIGSAKKELIAHSFQALGEFHSRNRARSTVEAPLGGRVLGLLVEEGETVTINQPVVRLESPELSRLLAEHHHAQRKLELLEQNAGQEILLAEQGPDSQAPLNQARTRLQKARAQAQGEEAHLKEVSLRKERLEKLLKVGIPSQEQVDGVRAEHLQALAAYQAARDEESLALDVFKKESLLNKSGARASLVKRKVSAELHLAREEVRHQSELLEVLGKDADEESPIITLRAPTSGSVVSISVKRGEFVDQSQTILQIMQGGDVYPLIWIPSSRVPEVSVGTGVNVFFSADSSGHEAKISWLAPELDPESHSLAARLELEDKNLTARAGVFLKAEVQAREHEALVVPKSALTVVEGNTCLYVAVNELSFQRREVKTGVESDTSVEILEGLKAGERFAIDGVFLLKSYDLGTEGE